MTMSPSSPPTASHPGGSPYLFPAAEHELRTVSDRLKVREAVSGFGIALRYQDRPPPPPAAPEAGWGKPAPSFFVLSGRISYRCDAHTTGAGPGDMVHTPGGPAHRHKPRVVGAEPV